MSSGSPRLAISTTAAPPPPGSLQPLFTQINECGRHPRSLRRPDRLRPRRRSPRARARDGRRSRFPSVAVLGNHDFESGQQDESPRRSSLDAGVMHARRRHHRDPRHRLRRRQGIRRRLRPPRARPVGRRHHQEVRARSGDEALKLESALARLRNDHLIAVLHYSPIQATVEGEPLEIFPFLGCSRLEEPLNRYPVTAVFHGHAHHGQPGRPHREERPGLQRLDVADARAVSRASVPALRDRHDRCADETARPARDRRRSSACTNAITSEMLTMSHLAIGSLMLAHVLVAPPAGPDGRAAAPRSSRAAPRPTAAVADARCQQQVMLDRAGFSPGAIDGRTGHEHRTRRSPLFRAERAISTRRSRGD